MEHRSGQAYAHALALEDPHASSSIDLEYLRLYIDVGGCLGRKIAMDLKNSISK